MAAKAKIPLKKLREFIKDLTEVLAPLKPVKARVKYVGAFDVDKQGGWKLGGKADIADVTTLVGGAPLAIEGGVHAEHDTDGSADLELEIEFG